jgi:formate dehydrogenase iron-sulfur subunit
MSRIAMLIDESICMGCRGCQVACKQWNDLPAEQTRQRGSYENPPDLSPVTWTKVRFFEIADDGNLQWLFLTQGCLHCGNPACVEVCPTGALKQDPRFGIVTVEPDLCNGCGYCTQFCPFGIPRLDADVLSGEGRAYKCNFCQDRVSNGLPPACVKTCPSGAFDFGDRDQMLAKGRIRVEELKQQGFSNANLYGEHEMGGLGRLYVLKERPSLYGLPENPQYPVVADFWQDIVQPLGTLSFGAAALAVLGFYFLARRNIRMEEVE